MEGRMDKPTNEGWIEGYFFYFFYFFFVDDITEPRREV